MAVIVPDAARPFYALGTLGLSADNDGRIIDVDPDGPAGAAHIIPFREHKTGDAIDLHATSRDDLLAVFGGMGGLQYLIVGRTVSLHLIDPAGTRRTVTLRAEPAPLDPMASFVLELNVAFGVAFILLAAFLVWVHPRRSTVGFFLFALWYNPGQYFMYYALLPPGAVVVQEVLQAIFQAAGLAGFVEFALRFPNEQVEGWRRPVERALPAVFLLFAVLGVLTFGTAFGYKSELISRVTYGLAYALYPIIVLAFITKLRVLPPTDSLRLRAVIAGCIPGLFFFILADSIESTSLWQGLWNQLDWSPPEMWLNLCYLVNALVAVSVGYAVVCQRVLPIAFLINRGLALGTVWVIVAMFVEGILILADYVLKEHHLLSGFVAALAFVLFAPLIERLKELVNEVVDRVVFRHYHEADRQLRLVGDALSEARSVDGIDRQLVAAPVEALGLAAAALFRLGDDGRFAIAPHAHNWPSTAAQAFDPDDPLVLHVSRYHGPMRMREVIRDNADLPSGIAFPAVVIPVAVERSVDAFVFYAGHLTGTDLTPDEIALLVRLARAGGFARDHVLARMERSQLEQLRRTLASLGAVAQPSPAGGTA